MSKFTRTLAVGATLAAIALAGMTTAAQAQATDEPTRHGRPPTQGQVGEAWHQRQAEAKEQTAAEATLGRVLARERFSIPDATPAQPTTPAPTQPDRPPSWLLASLGVLAVVMLVAGLSVLGARRARRRAPPPAASLTR